MAKRHRIVTIIGARPQFLKAAPLSTALRSQFHETIIHTGQHYDWAMSGRFFDELSIPKPDYNLNVGSGSHAQQLGTMMMKIEPLLARLRPSIVVVFGDTNSTLAGAVVAARLQIPIAHIEAGMRSFDWTMPEEQNRVLTDRVSTLLFCPSPVSVRNLKNEGMTKGVVRSGDNMLDILFSVLPRARRLTTIIRDNGLQARHYLLLTLHRASNTDSVSRLRSIMAAVSRSKDPVVFPVHPRTKAALARAGMLTKLRRQPNIRLLEPVGYLEMVALMADAAAVLTDSGGVQKEAFSLKTPCITLRQNTEWTETVDLGWNVLVGHDTQKILRALRRPPRAARHRAVYGTGHASERIAHGIAAFLNRRAR